MTSTATERHVEDVGVPVDGFTSIAPKGTTLPTAAEMADPDFSPPAAFKGLGLRTADGAPDWAEAPSEMIELYEEVDVSAGSGKLTVTQTFAEYGDKFRGLIRGATVTDGVMDVDIDQVVECVLYTEDRFRQYDGTFVLRRRLGDNARITSVSAAKPQRGQIPGTVVTWSVKRSQRLGGKHFREAVVPIVEEEPEGEG